MKGKGITLLVLPSLDKNSNIPYYLQLKEIIQAKIEDGELNPGDKLPGEVELCRIMGVSRTVVRQALLELVYDGLIYKLKGKGTYVAEPKMVIAVNYWLAGFGESLTRRGINTKNEVLKQEVITANQKIADNHSGVSKGDDVFHLERVRYVNSEPLALSNTYIPFSLCPALVDMDLSRSLYSCLKKSSGIEMDKGEIFFESVKATKKEAKILDVELGAPMLLNITKTFDLNGNQVEYQIAVFRGDRSRIKGAIFHVNNLSASDKRDQFDSENFLITNS